MLAKSPMCVRFVICITVRTRGVTMSQCSASLSKYWSFPICGQDPRSWSPPFYSPLSSVRRPPRCPWSCQAQLGGGNPNNTENITSNPASLASVDVEKYWDKNLKAIIWGNFRGKLTIQFLGHPSWATIYLAAESPLPWRKDRHGDREQG